MSDDSLLHKLILEQSNRMEREYQRRGVSAYLLEPEQRQRPSTVKLNRVLKHALTSNRVKEENLMWMQKKQLEEKEKRTQRRRDEQQRDSTTSRRRGDFSSERSSRSADNRINDMISKNDSSKHSDNEENQKKSDSSNAETKISIDKSLF